jgi:hypothetical protein
VCVFQGRCNSERVSGSACGCGDLWNIISRHSVFLGSTVSEIKRGLPFHQVIDVAIKQIRDTIAGERDEVVERDGAVVTLGGICSRSRRSLDVSFPIFNPLRFI